MATIPAAATDGRSKAATTRRVYACHWARWYGWADAKDARPLPARPEDVAAHLADRAVGGASLSTLQQARAAIAAAHRDAGYLDPTDNDAVRGVLSGFIREVYRPRQQVTPLTVEDLAAIRATAYQPRTGPSGRRESPEQAHARGQLDIALASVMRDGLLGPGEAAAVTWGDISPAADGTGRLTVRRSKTGRGGDGAVQDLGVDAMNDLVEIEPDGASPGAPVFRLSPQQITRRIDAAAAAAGLEGRYRGHSPRVGMARDLAAAGCGVVELMTAGRWLSAIMPARYAHSEGPSAVSRFYANMPGT